MKTFLSLIFIVAAITASPGTESAGRTDDLPPVPQSHILDRARIFKPEAMQDLSRRLVALEHTHGISLHVAAYTFLTNESIDEHAIRLKNHWVESTNGVVVVYVRSTSQISFAASEQFDDTLSATDLMDIFTAAAAKARTGQDTDVRHHELITIACDHVATALTARVGTRLAKKTEHRNYLRAFAIGFGLLLILISVAGFLFSRSYERRRALAKVTHHFPDVAVAQRFGARHGGGSLAEISFGPSA